ncbi:MAG: endonuclease [Flavobacterium sp. BFFFF1]|uniref:GIY-YIG nuclease family protein n=1 Tax=Flavobacterium sp. BFFFF1 TaxID=2015557 RepID=UPI000BC4B267|nr:GIY-YIG nuclease family protein [Flavobacterium sp. BFFFF1]OYU80194.1 MAG: endonuclease [Flavobacterium sp. BFFFF1]
MHFHEGYHTYYIYIITNKSKTVLYTGVTGNLKNRLQQHSENIQSSIPTFASRYQVHYLLYFEKFTWIDEAIAREKEIKKWRREKKLNLIKTINPSLDFLDNWFQL